MNIIPKIIITAAIGYLLGCSHMSYYIAKFKHIDLKSQGSRNYGASNTMALIGWKFGILTGLHDILKSVLAIVLIRLLFPGNMYLAILAGVCSVLGHIFPFYLKFDGGKGFASFVGMTFALNWKLGICVGILIIILTLVTDFIVIGTFSTILITPISIAIIYRNVFYGLLILCVSLVILLKHKENMKRLQNGTEMRFSKANKNEYKTKERVDK